MLVLTRRDGEILVVAPRHITTIAAARPDETVMTLTDGRRIPVRESFVEVLARWRTTQPIY
jgi:uncharacterized protein YlzI (FlbEa/FlbD family)